ncbi:armadillo-type protein [Lentinula raphanica]|nr:armadillo-type protein [Lentinula raphanica]
MRSRYDRQFLLEFLSICQEKPDDLPTLEAIALELPSRAPLTNIQSQTQTGRNLSRSNIARSSPFRSLDVRITRGPGRFRGKTGLQKSKVQYQQFCQADASDAGTTSVAPSLSLGNRRDRWTLAVAQVEDSPEFVQRKVKALLNKLTEANFDSISDQILEWANKTEKETNGRTLIQVLCLIFEKATDEAIWSEMYARLCFKMMERISPRVQDDGIKNSEGKPVAGGKLFRKYLLNRCQEDFERGWVIEEAPATEVIEDHAVKASTTKKEVPLYSDEYYAAQKAKRRGLGLIKFIGELFKLQMLTERIMHECVKKLISDVENPEEEEIESLCKLLTTVGPLLDTAKGRAHMNVYFDRMNELTKSPNINSRTQFMLQDVVELRERKWLQRNAVFPPATVAKIHEAVSGFLSTCFQSHSNI